MPSLRDDAVTIFKAAIAAADPVVLTKFYFADPNNAVSVASATGGRVAVLGGGKAGAAMATGVETGLVGHLDSVWGIVSVPGGSRQPELKRITLREARPAGSNHPTEQGVAAAEDQLRLVETLLPGDVALCLFSGGGSAILPAPVEGVSLADKQLVTRLLHSCGATINEMNAVRKHLSRYKGGRLAQKILERGAKVVSLIISDVVGDPLDVIASGPTAPDPTTFTDAVAILKRYGLIEQTPAAVVNHLQQGADGALPETPKTLPGEVQNVVLGSNTLALAAAAEAATRLGYRVLNLGSFIEGETRDVAETFVGIVRSVRENSIPLAPPACILLGGETTVTMGARVGKGGRNQEFVLSALLRLGERVRNTVVLSGGTDGEDGPTDAAGALGDEGTLGRAVARGLDPRQHLQNHDAYPLFDATADLLRTGLTQTNVMDIRIFLLK